MHEMSLMASMLEILEDHARQEGALRVTQVVMAIGRLSGVEPEAMRFAFDVVTHGTVAQGAELVIDVVPGRARCQGCGAEAVLEAIFDPCPACGDGPMAIQAGREMKLVSLCVE